MFVPERHLWQRTSSGTYLTELEEAGVSREGKIVDNLWDFDSFHETNPHFIEMWSELASKRSSRLLALLNQDLTPQQKRLLVGVSGKLGPPVLFGVDKFMSAANYHPVQAAGGLVRKKKAKKKANKKTKRKTKRKTKKMVY